MVMIVVEAVGAADRKSYLATFRGPAGSGDRVSAGTSLNRQLLIFSTEPAVKT